MVPLFWIMVNEGPGTSGSSGSGRLYADGTVVRITQEPAFSFAHFGSAAFLVCLVSLVLSLASFWRREQLLLSLCALSYGLTPAFLYLWLGFILGALPSLAFTAALIAVALFRKLRERA